MNYYYICTTGLMELMLIAMILHVVYYSGFKLQQKVWYILTFASIILCSAAELAVHCGVYKSTFAIPLTIVTVIQFSLSPLLAVFFSGALGLHEAGKKALWVFSLNALIEIISAPFGLIFYFNDEGYFRGDFFFIYEIFYFIGFIYLIISMYVVGKRFKHRDAVTILMVVVLLVAGIIPMTLLQLHIAYISIGMCATLCYIYYNDLVQADIKSELISNQKKISRMQEHTITGLATLIESRDIDTGEHIARTAEYAEMIAENARKDGIYTDEIDDHFIELMYILAPMHDVGKIVVPDGILKKPGKLTEEEYGIMKKHAAAGGEEIHKILNGIADDEYIRIACDIAKYHHEKWNGKGYPEGLSGEDIPLCARIMAIADVFDALISERCYKKPIPVEEALEILRKEAGEHFDPKLVNVFVKHYGGA